MTKINRQWASVGGIIVLLAALVGLGWLKRDSFLPVEVGTRAPNFVATDREGRQVSLADLRGEVVLLNIWATWCPPCREEMPSMQRLYEELGPQGLRMVAVSIDRETGKRGVLAFAEEYGLTFDIWHDPAGEIQRIYRTTGVPETFLIDRNGVVVSKVLGATEWDSEVRVESVRRLLEGG